MLKNRFLLHTILWILVFWIMLKLTADEATPNFADYLYAGILIIPIILLAYVNGLVLLPILFSKKRFASYFASIILATLIFSTLVYTLFEIFLGLIYPSFIFVSIFGFFDLIFLGTTTITISSLLYFTISWFNSEQQRKQMAILLQQKSDAELKLLKSQLNPHFLFNTLNSIYALVLRKSDSAADALIQLSDIIRYMVYETGSSRILLSRELEVLHAYVELQRMRLNSDTKVLYQQNGNPDSKQIAPMLLFPFVENAFKHGTKSAIKNAFVHISIDLTEDCVKLYIQNCKRNIPNDGTEVSGIGLNNVKQLLELTYPNNYKLKIVDKQNTFSINLTINLLV